MGSRKTGQRISKKKFWPGMDKQIKAFVQSCPECQLTATKRKADRAPLCDTPIITTPFEVITIDLAGPINPPSSTGKKYVLVAVDDATRWVELYPLATMKAEGVCKALIQIL